MVISVVLDRWGQEVVVGPNEKDTLEHHELLRATSFVMGNNGHEMTMEKYLSELDSAMVSAYVPWIFTPEDFYLPKPNSPPKSVYRVTPSKQNFASFDESESDLEYEPRSRDSRIDRSSTIYRKVKGKNMELRPGYSNPEAVNNYRVLVSNLIRSGQDVDFGIESVIRNTPPMNSFQERALGAYFASLNSTSDMSRVLADVFPGAFPNQPSPSELKGTNSNGNHPHFFHENNPVYFPSSKGLPKQAAPKVVLVPGGIDLGLRYDPIFGLR